MTCLLHVPLGLHNLVSCSFPFLVYFLLSSHYLALETSRVYIHDFFSGNLHLLSLLVSLPLAPLRTTCLKHCFHHSFSFSATQEEPPASHSKPTCLCLASLMLDYVLPKPDQSDFPEAPLLFGHFSYCLSGGLFICVFTITWFVTWDALPLIVPDSAKSRRNLTMLFQE